MSFIILQNDRVLNEPATLDEFVSTNEFGSNVKSALFALRKGQAIELRSDAAGKIEVRRPSLRRKTRVVRRFHLRY